MLHFAIVFVAMLMCTISGIVVGRVWDSARRKDRYTPAHSYELEAKETRPALPAVMETAPMLPAPLEDTFYGSMQKDEDTITIDWLNRLKEEPAPTETNDRAPEPVGFKAIQVTTVTRVDTVIQQIDIDAAAFLAELDRRMTQTRIDLGLVVPGEIHEETRSIAPVSASPANGHARRGAYARSR